MSKAYPPRLDPTEDLSFRPTTEDLQRIAAVQKAAYAEAAFEDEQPKPKPKPKHRSVPQMLKDGAETFEDRNTQYGDAYKRIGAVLEALLPHGLPAMSTESWNRFGVLMMIIGKTVRYSHDICNPHRDSAHDLMVYAAMLEELSQ